MILQIASVNRIFFLSRQPPFPRRPEFPLGNERHPSHRPSKQAPPVCPHFGVNGEREIPLSADLLKQQWVCQAVFYTVSGLLFSKLHVSPTDS